MKYLYIDESYNQNVFIVGGIIANKDDEIIKTYNKFKKQLKIYPLSENKKRKIMYEFKSVILDKSFPKIKEMFLEYIKNSNIYIIYSYKKIIDKLTQEKKEIIYLELLKT